MAIDTAAKRKSSIGIGLISLRTGIIPDGTISEADRRHLNFLYSGSDVAVVTSVTSDFIAMNLYVEQTRSQSMYIEQSRSINQYIEQTRSFNLEK